MSRSEIAPLGRLLHVSDRPAPWSRLTLAREGWGDAFRHLRGWLQQHEAAAAGLWRSGDRHNDHQRDRRRHRQRLRMRLEPAFWRGDGHWRRLRYRHFHFEPHLAPDRYFAQFLRWDLVVHPRLTDERHTAVQVQAYLG